LYVWQIDTTVPRRKIHHMSEYTFPEATQNAIDTAQRILSQQWGQPIKLSVAHEFSSQSTVLRCGVEKGSAEHPSSIILKILPHHEHDRREEGLNLANRFFNEWGSLLFLSGLESNQELAPLLIAADEDSGLVIIGDMGEHPTLVDIWEGNDRVLAEKIVVEGAVTLGRIHTESIGQSDRYWAFVDAHDYVPPLVDGNIDLRKFLFRFKPLFEDLGIEISEAFWDEFLEVQSRLHSEGPFYGFTHFDLGPHNMLAVDDGVRIMDFEMAKFGHVLIDVVDPRMNFPSCNWGLRIPSDLVETWEAAHREALRVAYPAAGDDAQYYPAMVDACAHWAIQKFGGFYGEYLMPRMAEGDTFEAQVMQEKGERIVWLKTWTMTRLRSFVAYAEHHDCLPHFRETIQRLIDRVEEIAPGISELGDLELFPAFR
jgi:hypothetical protein